MRYKHSREGKCTEGHGFLEFVRNVGDKYDKKLQDTVTKTVQKTIEATGDLIGNKIADNINSVGKSKESKK